MRYLHTMVRIADIEQSLDFYCDKMGMVEIRRLESQTGRYTLIFLGATEDSVQATDTGTPTLELTFNWDPENYTGGRNFGHVAYGPRCRLFPSPRLSSIGPNFMISSERRRRGQPPVSGPFHRGELP